MAKSITTDSIKVEVKLPEGKNTITFICEYAKDFKGEKTMLEGSVHEVSVDVAELFVSKGYGKIV